MTTHKRFEILIKVALVIFLFCFTLLAFKALQKPIVYNSTLGEITHTYSRDTVLKHIIWEVDKPYYYPNYQNMCRWDANHYSNIRENYYNKDDSKYAFFPLFPLLWRFSGISLLYIGLLNYLLFGISIILLSKILLNKENTSLIERLCIFTVALTLPPIVVYYLPYAEALYIFLYVLAFYALVKNKYWMFFISLMLFSMTRPTFAIVGLSFVIMDILYFLKHKNVLFFFKELFMKLSPILLGTSIVFTMFYFNSGSFTKYFESINTYWHTSFSLPTKIADWSIEGFGMNTFAIFFVIIPSLILFVRYFITSVFLNSSLEPKQLSIFKGDIESIKSYFYNQSIVYFWGVFLFIVFFQHGELNGMARYTISSPFFFIFLFYFYSEMKEFKLNIFLPIILLLIVFSMFFLTGQLKLKPEVNFNDSGYFTLLLSFIYLFFLKFLNKIFKIILLGVLVIYNVVWITYLYNVYLCDGWIFT